MRAEHFSVTVNFKYSQMCIFNVSDCTNELHNFYYDSEDFYHEKVHGSPRWNLPLTNTFHALTLICFMGNIIITPIGYGAIYRFRKNQDNNVPGIRNSARNKRKNRNLVTMKINMINWSLEIITTLLVAILHPYRYFTLLYILVNSCGTPLFYFLGIEENKTMAKSYRMEEWILTIVGIIIMVYYGVAYFSYYFLLIFLTTELYD